MPQMTAKHAFPYGVGKKHRNLEVGDTFETETDRDADVLEAAGRAERTNKVAEKEAQTEAKRRGRPPKYETKVVEPATSEVKTDKDDDLTITRDRFYGRRDMEADSK